MRPPAPPARAGSAPIGSSPLPCCSLPAAGLLAAHAARAAGSRVMERYPQNGKLLRAYGKFLEVRCSGSLPHLPLTGTARQAAAARSSSRRSISRPEIEKRELHCPPNHCACAGRAARPLGRQPLLQRGAQGRHGGVHDQPGQLHGRGRRGGRLHEPGAASAARLLACHRVRLERVLHDAAWRRTRCSLNACLLCWPRRTPIGRREDGRDRGGQRAGRHHHGQPGARPCPGAAEANRPAVGHP